MDGYAKCAYFISSFLIQCNWLCEILLSLVLVFFLSLSLRILFVLFFSIDLRLTKLANWNFFFADRWVDNTQWHSAGSSYFLSYVLCICGQFFADEIKQKVIFFIEDSDIIREMMNETQSCNAELIYFFPSNHSYRNHTFSLRTNYY